MKVRRGKPRVQQINPLLNQTKPNIGTRVKYERELIQLIDEMYESTQYWLLANYKKSSIAQDESIVSIMKRAIAKMTKQWFKKYDTVAEDLAKNFVDKSTVNSDFSLKNAFEKIGFTVEFKTTDAIDEKIKSSVYENTQLIKSIPQKYFNDLNFIITEGINRGFDVGYIADQIKQKYNVTKRRAAFIARDQAQKVHSIITVQRQLDLGITKGIWVHSGGGKVPRKSHLKAGRDKLEFDLQKGAYIDGEYILPGQKPNCRCTWFAVIPWQLKTTA